MQASFHSWQFSRNFASPLQMQLIDTHGVANGEQNAIANDNVLNNIYNTTVGYSDE